MTQFLPLSCTILTRVSADSPQFKDFERRFRQLQARDFQREKMPSKHCHNNLWIVKPQNLNQGRGITLQNSLKEIHSLLAAKPSEKMVIQKYLQRPLLYQNRKFDIRVWVLVTVDYQVYFYGRPYLRTSSVVYDNQNLDNLYVHLTNNTLQKSKANPDYQLYQPGNTLPFTVLESYLPSRFEAAQDCCGLILARMKQIVTDVMLSAKKPMLKQMKRREFELLGFDFMLDEDLRLWLLEVNDNPYIGAANQYIEGVLADMAQEMLQIILDQVCPPTAEYQPCSSRFFQLLLESGPKHRRTSQIKAKIYPLNTLQPVKKTIKRQEIPHIQELRNNRYSIYDSIRYINETYPFNDFEPYYFHIRNLFGVVLSQAEDTQKLKLLNLVAQSRVAPILVQPKNLQFVRKVLGSKVSLPCKTALLKALLRALKTPKSKRLVLQTLCKEFFELAVEGIPSDQEIDLGVLSSVLVRMAGDFSRLNYIPGQTRQYQQLRNQFIQKGGLVLLIYLSRFVKGLSLDNFGKVDWIQQQNCLKEGKVPQIFQALFPKDQLSYIVKNKIGESLLQQVRQNRIQIKLLPSTRHTEAVKPKRSFLIKKTSQVSKRQKPSQSNVRTAALSLRRKRKDSLS